MLMISLFLFIDQIELTILVLAETWDVGMSDQWYLVMCSFSSLNMAWTHCLKSGYLIDSWEYMVSLSEVDENEIGSGIKSWII